MFIGASKCSEREAESFLQMPNIWEPIRRELFDRFPDYPRLAPGQSGPSRSQYHRWKRYLAERPGLQSALDRCFSEQAVRLAREMGMFDPSHRGFAHPQLSDQLIGDGTVAKAMFDSLPGDVQYNPETDECEQIRHDSDARKQVQKDDDGNIIDIDSAGTHYCFMDCTTGHTGETLVLDHFHVPAGPGYSEANVAIERITALVERLGEGVKGVMWDKAMRGKQIDQIYDLGLLCHARVAKAPGGGPKETLIEMVDVRVGGEIVGQLPLVALAGAAHIRIDTGTESHLIALTHIINKVRSNTGQRSRPFRMLQEARVPDDPRVPSRFRGGHIRTRLDTTTEDRDRGINRAENLRPVAEIHDDWKIVGGQRSRAEALNSKVKHRWANARLNAVGVPRQMIRLLGIFMAINREAAIRYAQRTSSQAPPGQQAA
jgi:hypothetical protein